jgi:phage recombination protein Bet
MNNKTALQVRKFTPEQIACLKRTICKGASNDELALFLHIAANKGLDPFSNQIHAVFYYDSTLKRKVMTPITGIDGYRALAARDGDYAPGPEPTFEYHENGEIISATAYVQKKVDGDWMVFSATARWKEYVQLANGKPRSNWARMPHVMLAKCAEALALRKGWPHRLSGLYVREELDQATSETIQVQAETIHRGTIKKVGEKRGHGENPWVCTIAEMSDGSRFSTFSKSIGERVWELEGAEVEIAFTAQKKGNRIDRIAPVISESEQIQPPESEPNASELPPMPEEEIPF